MYTSTRFFVGFRHFALIRIASLPREGGALTAAFCALVMSGVGWAPLIFAEDAVLDKADVNLFNPTPEDKMRSFNTDRPPKANSPYTVDAGHLQYETDLAVFESENTGGVRTHQWTFLDPTLKLGVTNSVDAELQLTPYESQSARSATERLNASGFGDTIVRVKINVIGNDSGALSIGVLPYVKIPTAATGLGNRSVEAGLIIPLTLSAPLGFTVTLMPEGDYVRNAGNVGYHTVFDFLVNASHALDKQWTAYTELFTSQPFKSTASATYTLDEGFACLLTPSLQIDIGANLGINNTAPKVQVYAGLSQRF